MDQFYIRLSRRFWEANLAISADEVAPRNLTTLTEDFNAVALGISLAHLAPIVADGN